MNVTLLNIFCVFLKVGALLLGGGYVILPMLTSELVEKRNWITKEELVNYYAISQCLPGIIAINTAVFAGYKLRGKYGAFFAILGMCASPFLAIICLASILSKLTNNPIVINVFWGVAIGIIVLILLTLKEVWSKSIVDKFSLFLFLLIFGLTAFFGLSPVWAIVVAAVFGLFYKIAERRFSK